MDTHLLTTGEVARLLGASRQHIVDLCDSGAIMSMRAGSHRRIPRSEVDRLTHLLTRGQEKSWWLHQALFAELLTSPDKVLRTARSNLKRWRAMHRSDGMSVHRLEEWEQILDAGLDSVIEAVSSRSPHACELRKNTPFAGALPADTRLKVLQSFEDHWAREHRRDSA